MKKRTALRTPKAAQPKRSAMPPDLAEILSSMDVDGKATIDGWEILRANLHYYRARRVGARTWGAERTPEGIRALVFVLPAMNAAMRSSEAAAEKGAARLAELDELLEGLSEARKAAEREHSRQLVARLAQLVTDCGFTFEEAQTFIAEKPRASTEVSLAAAHVATIRLAILEIEALHTAAAADAEATRR